MSLRDSNAVFTVCNVAYLNKVLVLAESVYKHNGIKLDVFVFDKRRELCFEEDYCNIHWMEELYPPEFTCLSFKYTVVELTTSYKAWLALFLLKKNSKVLFLDPDVMVFNSLNSIFLSLENHPVVLTPHYFIPKINGLIDDEQLMRFGAFNLGFFAVNHTKESKQFLNWWSNRCLENAFDDTQFGIFTDQKWISVASIFFPYIHVSYNPGLNVAYWNLDERVLSKDNNGRYLVNDENHLLFFHFSAFSNSCPEDLSRKKYNGGNNLRSTLAELGLLYSEKLGQYVNISNELTYSYDYMSDGKYISPSLRRAYSAFLEEFPEGHDPFDSDGVVAKFASKNDLFEKGNARYAAEGYSSIEGHPVKLKFIYLIMRLILKVLGPNNFMNISRLLVYLSRYHRNRNIWRL